MSKSKKQIELEREIELRRKIELEKVLGDLIGSDLDLLKNIEVSERELSSKEGAILILKQEGKEVNYQFAGEGAQWCCEAIKDFVDFKFNKLKNLGGGYKDKVVPVKLESDKERKAYENYKLVNKMIPELKETIEQDIVTCYNSEKYKVIHYQQPTEGVEGDGEMSYNAEAGYLFDRGLVKLNTGDLINNGLINNGLINNGLINNGLINNGLINNGDFKEKNKNYKKPGFTIDLVRNPYISHVKFLPGTKIGNSVYDRAKFDIQGIRGLFVEKGVELKVNWSDWKRSANHKDVSLVAHSKEEGGVELKVNWSDWKRSENHKGVSLVVHSKEIEVNKSNENNEGKAVNAVPKSKSVSNQKIVGEQKSEGDITNNKESVVNEPQKCDVKNGQNQDKNEKSKSLERSKGMSSISDEEKSEDKQVKQEENNNNNKHQNEQKKRKNKEKGEKVLLLG